MRSVRSLFRSSEAALIILSLGVGLAAGFSTTIIHGAARFLQEVVYGIKGDSLSASSTIDPWRLLALPIGGLVLGLSSRAILRRWRTPVDIVEANALHGGVIPWRDSVLVCAQTLVSNGAGA